jgi:NDP-sugar pyrophosphorylase family protein
MTQHGDLTLVVPAAGRGTRFFGTGRSAIPKGMIYLRECPLLEHVLMAGSQLRLAEIVVIINSAGRIIREHFGNWWRGYRMRYVVQEKPEGLAQAVSLAQPFVANSMLVLNGDEIIAGGRLADIRRYAEQQAADGIVGYLSDVDRDRISRAYGLTVDSSQRVAHLVEKPSLPWNNLLGVGVWLLGKEYFDCFNRTAINARRGERDFVAVVQQMIGEGSNIYGMDLKAGFVNVNTPDDLMEAESLLDRTSLPDSRPLLRRR